MSKTSQNLYTTLDDGIQNATYRFVTEARVMSDNG